MLPILSFIVAVERALAKSRFGHFPHTNGLIWISPRSRLALAWRDGLEIAPLLAVIAAITIAYLIFHPSTRYRAPADPFVFILAAYALASVWAARIAPRWGRAVDRT